MMLTNSEKQIGFQFGSAMEDFKIVFTLEDMVMHTKDDHLSQGSCHAGGRGTRSQRRSEAIVYAERCSAW